jgi:hypothetical protein
MVMRGSCGSWKLTGEGRFELKRSYRQTHLVESALRGTNLFKVVILDVWRRLDVLNGQDGRTDMSIVL